MALNTITEVRLLSVPLESDYIHTLHFDTEAEQIAYFKGKTKKSENDFSYQRKDQAIRYPLHIDDLWECNYVMYRNAFYNNKWFYAFIKKMEYINDGVTMIHIETDAIQTWYFDYNVKTCFVEREHSADDRIGTNTILEGLELGEYVSNVHNKDDSLKENHKFVVASTVAVDGVAYLFTAPCGTGKSTHTRLWRERFGDRAVMVNDDKPIIRLIDGKFYAYGTPWNGKHRLSTDIKVPIKAVCILDRGEENRIEKIAPKDALVKILDQTLRPTEPALLDKELDLIGKFLKSVNLYKLWCNVSLDAAKLSYGVMSKGE